MALSVYRRKAWRARPPRPLTPDRAKRELFIHHSAGTFAGPPQSIDTAAEMAEVMRRIQNFHMGSNGWADIGYHYVVFQPYGKLRLARVFEGRPVNTLPAAQAGHNTGTIAVCVVDGAKGEKLRLSTKLQLIRLARLLKKSHNVQRLRGHYEVTATSCPGGYIKPHLAEIARRAGLRR